jgi:hypothetical protein
MKIKKIVAVFWVVLVSSVMLSLLFAGEEADKKADLRLRLEKGQSYKMKSVKDLKINQIIPGQQQVMTINQKTMTKNTYLVGDIQTDGNVPIKVTFDTIFFSQEGMGQNIVYDSSNPSNSVGPMAAIWDAITGQSITIVVTPEGKVKQVQGADALLTRIQKKIADLPDAQMRHAMEISLKMQFSEEALKNNMEGSLNVYPDKPVGIGDAWQKRTAISQGFPMSVNTTYTLREQKDAVAIIDILSTIYTDKGASPIEAGPNKVQYNMSGTLIGTMQMQESTGWITRSNTNMKLSGEMTVENSGAKQPISIPMSITGTITDTQEL